ncbi:MAG TPA: DNA polymerase III subunit delta [Vicinamibacteria bacterium]|jgi:DNA polymerase-3 subunit delta
MPPARSRAVVAILGADSFRAEEALEAVVAEAVGSERGDGVEAFRGDETTWARVVEAARTPSLFAPRRAVVVRGADALKDDGAGVPAYIADPTPGTTLVVQAVKPDKRRAVWKALLEKATVVEAEPLKGRALRAHVLARAKARRLPLNEPAMEELLERVGQDLRRLEGEMEKLAAYAEGRSAPLSAEEVAAVLGRGLAQPIYRIGDALAARRPALVLELVNQALDEGEAPLRILGNLHYALRRVRGAKALGRGPGARDAVVSRLGVLPFKAGDVLEAARAWSEAELEDATAAFYEADRRLKSSQDGRVVLAAAIAEACGRDGSGRRKGRALVRRRPTR